jgi:hypothetical protein
VARVKADAGVVGGKALLDHFGSTGGTGHAARGSAGDRCAMRNIEMGYGPLPLIWKRRLKAPQPERR